MSYFKCHCCLFILFYSSLKSLASSEVSVFMIFVMLIVWNRNRLTRLLQKADRIHFEIKNLCSMHEMWIWLGINKQKTMLWFHINLSTCKWYNKKWRYSSQAHKISSILFLLKITIVTYDYVCLDLLSSFFSTFHYIRVFHWILVEHSRN